MNATTLSLSFTTLLFAAGPLMSTEPAPVVLAQSDASSTAQDLERQAREALGGIVDQKARELTERLRGRTGQASSAGVEEGESDPSSADEDEVDPLIEKLTRIEDRLSTIEGLLCDLSSRSVPCASAVSPAGSATEPVAAPRGAVAAVGAAVTTGFAKARIRSWHHGRDATVKLSINGLPAGRFDTDMSLDLAQFLKPSHANQLAFTIEPHGKVDASGMELWVEAQMQGSDDFVPILQFKATKDRVADAIDIPWATR